MSSTTCGAFEYLRGCIHRHCKHILPHIQQYCTLAMPSYTQIFTFIILSSPYTLYIATRIDLRRPTDTTLFLIVKQASRSLKYQKDSICLLKIRSTQCHFLELGKKTVSGRNWIFLSRAFKVPAIFPINDSLLYTQICYRINLFTF